MTAGYTGGTGLTGTATTGGLDTTANSVGAQLAGFVQGKVVGDYYINTDGSVDETTNVPWYPNLTFGGTTPGQFH